MEIEALLSRARVALASDSNRGSAALLHGPPGCGKTMIIKHVAAQLSCHCVWLGIDAAQSFQGVAPVIHAQLEAARAASPSLLLIDELDAICPASAALGSTEHHLVLQLAEGIERLRDVRVFVLAACRSLCSVHPALRRSGRLHYTIAVRSPSPAQV